MHTKASGWWIRKQALQTVSDPLLGWATVDGLLRYVRQFRNMKGTIPSDAMDARALTDYAGVVGQLLTKGHARTSRRFDDRRLHGPLRSSRATSVFGFARVDNEA